MLILLQLITIGLVHFFRFRLVHLVRFRVLLVAPRLVQVRLPLLLLFLALPLESADDLVLHAIVGPQFPLGRLPEVSERELVHKVYLIQIIRL